MTTAAALQRAFDRARAGEELTRADGLALFEAEGSRLDELRALADEARRRIVGERVTYAVVCNINFTNICSSRCDFCGFARDEGDAEAFRLSLEEIGDRVAEAVARGATEVCLQGGIDPGMAPDHYVEILRAVRTQSPRIHIHAFSPFEVEQGAARCGMSIRAYLLRLKDAGLDSMPGTAAEIFDPELRRRLAPRKIGAENWADVVRTAHQIGIPTTATMMYGHIDGPAHWIAHMEVIRDLQKETGGFTEFVPLGFVPWKTALYRGGEARAGATREEHIKVHAVARLFLRGRIDHIQASWVKLGATLAQKILQSGADDFGGTLMSESIARAAGGTHGEEMTPEDFERLIRGIGRVPVRRDTLYRIG